MSYLSYPQGDFTVAPPITEAEIRGRAAKYAPTATPRGEYERLLWLDVTTSRRMIPEGELTVRQSSRIRLTKDVPLRDGALRDGLRNELQEIMDCLATTPDGVRRTFAGTVLVRGEESPYIWRVTIVDGRAVEEEPVLLWPNGDKEKVSL